MNNCSILKEMGQVLTTQYLYQMGFTQCTHSITSFGSEKVVLRREPAEEYLILVWKAKL